MVKKVDINFNNKDFDTLVKTINELVEEVSRLEEAVNKPTSVVPEATKKTKTLSFKK